MEHANKAFVQKHFRQIPRNSLSKQSTSMDFSRTINTLNLNATKPMAMRPTPNDGLIIRTHVRPTYKKKDPRKVWRRSYCVCSQKRPKRTTRIKPTKKLTLIVSSKWDTTASQTNTTKFISIDTQTRGFFHPMHPILKVCMWILCCMWHSLPIVALATWIANYYGYMQPPNREYHKTYNTWDLIVNHFKFQNQANQGLTAVQPINGLILTCLIILGMFFKTLSKF